MTDQQQREAARQFYYRWRDKGKEDEDARSYWIEILSDILGVDNVTQRLDFEKKVKTDDGNTKRIDVYIPETQVLIEQKSLGIPLDKSQVGHNGMTPYEQAKMYNNELPHSEKARWIITSNFAEIWIYDMEQKRPEPLKLTLTDIPSKYHLLAFLVKKEVQKVSDEMEISLQAGEIVGLLYDAFHKQYKDPDDPETLKSLNKLCVRIVFLLYGEDAGILGKKNLFHDYMEQFSPTQARKGLRDLFRVLNQQPEDRDPYLADDDPLLAAFPYVNGGLFADDDIEIPPFTDEIMELILVKASEEFDWSGISPTIFGAVFESTLNPETRRSGGMHYTSIENIHKVIDPLFLDDLKVELEELRQISVIKERDRKLRGFQDKLASLSFLDPAAGSGNFLTESYTCLRQLENEVIFLLTGGQISMGEVVNPIKVSISQFYGIEINDFAVTVARTALWIAENQMMKKTEDIVHMELDFLPLKTNAYIVEGNALRIDWNDVVPKEQLNYIMGNPPFVANTGRVAVNKSSVKGMMSNSQKEDKLLLFGKTGGVLDYVACWYKKAADYMRNTEIHSAFVSTNSICQGQQVSPLWKPLFNEGIEINFAYSWFKWGNETTNMAIVYVVIIGFSYIVTEKYIYSGETKKKVDNINAYLLDADNIFVDRRKKPISDVPEMINGGKPTDNGHLILTKEEMDTLVKRNPDAKKMIRPYMMGQDFINRKPRYCIWMYGVNPALIKTSPLVLERVQKVKEFRKKSTKEATRKKAETSMLFDEIRYAESSYVAIPKVSSGNRRYIPMDYLDSSIIPGDKLFFVQSISIYYFGVLESNVHMAWVRVVCSRYGPSYSYSNTIAYNNFPWPSPTDEQKATIEKTAQAILDARALYPDASLADLYDPLTMPPELLKAHQANDRAVMKAYGMPIRETDEAACVAWLMQLYQEKVAELEK